MKSLTAGDALSDRCVRVTEEMHPSLSGGNACREDVYAVFEEGCETSAGQGFLGLVDGRQVILFPHRIFADLLPSRQVSRVRLDTPMEDVRQQLLEGVCHCLPVVDNAGTFLGAVTRDSVLRLLVDREQQMFHSLKQGIDFMEQQRNLIAFEIHDGLIQYITAARMHFQAAAEHLEGLPPDATVQFARGMALLQEGIDDARCLIHGLHPPALESVGLVPAIESLVEQQLASDGQEIEFVRSPVPLRVSRFQETNIFRIVQEALTNAARHSGGTHVRIEISQQADHLAVEIRDDGRGFDAQAPHDGYGLKGMRYRTHALQGAFEVVSALGQGTRISVRVPT